MLTKYVKMTGKRSMHLFSASVSKHMLATGADNVSVKYFFFQC